MPTRSLRELPTLWQVNVSQTNSVRNHEDKLLHVMSSDSTETITNSRATLTAHNPRPKEKRKQSPIFLSKLACNLRIIGIGIRKIHRSMTRFVMLVE